jgi:hypothetical protein
MSMNQSSDTATSLESWLARSYTRFLQALQEHACKASPGGIRQGEASIDMSPFLPIEVNACFLESALNQHALDLAGALYHVLEIVIDVPAKKVLAANVIVQETGKPVQVVGVDMGSIQASVAAALGQRASVAELDDAALDALLATAGVARPAGSTAIPPVDVVRVVDARFHGRLMALAEKDGGTASLDSLARALGTLLAGCRDGLVRFHPVKDKLDSFVCKVGSAMRGLVLEDIATAASTFLPAGSAAIVLYTSEAMTAFRAARSRNGETTIAALPVSGVDDLLPIVPDVLDALANEIRNDAGVDVVLFLSLAGLVESVETLVDGIAAREHERNGPGLVQSILESLGIYARTFKHTWYSRPRAMVTKLFPRFLLRFAKIRLDLPRFLHDRAATSAVSAILGSFGKDFSLAVCFPVRRDGEASIKAIEISLKNLVPVGLASIDPALLAGANMKAIDASNLAQTVHTRLATAAPVPGSRFVLVIAPKVAAAIASAWKTMFRRVAWNPFALLDVFKRCRDPRALGLYPMPQAIGDLLKSKHKDVVRQLSRSFILKY